MAIKNKKIQLCYALFLIALVQGVVLSAQAQAFDQRDPIGSCDALWSSFQRQTGAEKISPAERVTGWGKLESKCHDKAAFRMRMVALYLDTGDLSSADSVAQEIPNGSRERRHANLMINFYQKFVLASQGKLSIDYRQLEQNYKTLTVDFPNWYIGYESLSQFALYAQDFPGAEQAAMKSVELAPDSVAYSSLAIASYLNKKYAQAVKAGNRALELDPGLAGKPDLMLRIAASYYGLQNIAEAKGVLTRLVAMNPEARESPAYQQVLTAINK